jgi:anti-anti-sigma factor
MTTEPGPALTVHRYDTPVSALITLVGEIDLDTVPQMRHALEQRLHDGIRTTDVDLGAVSFCDVSGLDAFLGVSQHAAAAGVSLQLHDPAPSLVRLLDITDCGFLLAGLALGGLHPPFLARPAPWDTAATCACCAADRQLTPAIPALAGGGQ